MVFGWWFREQLSLELVVLLEGVNVLHATLSILVNISIRVSFRLPPSQRTINIYNIYKSNTFSKKLQRNICNFLHSYIYLLLYSSFWEQFSSWFLLKNVNVLHIRS